MDPVIDMTLRAGLLLLFLTAASHKARDLGRFRATLAGYHLLPEMLVPLAALLVICVEVTVVAALAMPASRRAGLVSSAALLVVYGAAIAINLARGRRDIDCGCAAAAIRRPISEWLVARNGGLAAAALAGLGPVQARPVVWVDALTIVGATTVLAAVYLSLDRMLEYTPARLRLRGEA